MQFLRALRPRVARGEITGSVRIWRSARVKVAGRYRMLDGWIEIDSIQEIALQDITSEMARLSGFEGLVDLLKTARHGQGERAFWVRFHYVAPE